MKTGLIKWKRIVEHAKESQAASYNNFLKIFEYNESNIVLVRLEEGEYF